MKLPSLFAIITCGILATPVSGQNPQDISVAGIPVVSPAPGSVPESTKAVGSPAEEAPVLADQNVATLESGVRSKLAVDQVTDLAVLSRSGVPSVAGSAELARIAATYRESGKPETDCRKAALAVEQRVKLEPEELLAIVENEVSANPQCACEIVKSAVLASSAATEEVVSIVESAILAAPESMRLISQCAIAVSPDSLAAIQALLARYDGNAGEGESAKSAKGAKAAAYVAAEEDEVAPSPNPLDFPGMGPVGPTNGGPGGQPLVPPLPPIVTPPVTVVDP
jgi:hypothetical protein